MKGQRLLKEDHSFLLSAHFLDHVTSIGLFLFVQVFPFPFGLGKRDELTPYNYKK